MVTILQASSKTVAFKAMAQSQFGLKPNKIQVMIVLCYL